MTRLVQLTQDLHILERKLLNADRELRELRKERTRLKTAIAEEKKKEKLKPK